MSTSVKRSEKYLKGKASFSAFLRLNCSNVTLKQCQRSYSNQGCQRN